MKLEHRKQEVVSFPQFLFRLGRYALFSAMLITLSVLMGTIGYFNNSEPTKHHLLQQLHLLIVLHFNKLSAMTFQSPC